MHRTATRTGFNTNLDCDDPFSNNEPDSCDGVTFRAGRWDRSSAACREMPAAARRSATAPGQ
jgi:hypothetical protein